MITNGTATPANYYAVKFANTPLLYAYGVTALEAINEAAADWTSEHRNTLGPATARPAVYGEWDCWPECFTNDGNHNHNRHKATR